MRQLSLWAKVHPWSTRILIIFLLYPLMNFTGWLIGDLLWETGVEISSLWYYILLIPTFLLFAFYPSKRNFQRKYSYTYRKCFDVSLALLTMAFVMVWGNNLNKTETNVSAFQHSYANTSSNLPAASLEKQKIIKEKNLIKKIIKSIKNKYKNASKKERVGLIILAILGALFLALNVGALACNIMCAGSEVLGFLVLFVGVGLIVFGLVKVLRRIKQGPKPKEPETTPG